MFRSTSSRNNAFVESTTMPPSHEDGNPEGRNISRRRMSRTEDPIPQKDNNNQQYHHNEEEEDAKFLYDNHHGEINNNNAVDDAATAKTLPSRRTSSLNYEQGEGRCGSCNESDNKTETTRNSTTLFGSSCGCCRGGYCKNENHHHRGRLIGWYTLLVLAVGGAACSLILVFGLKAARKDQETQFSSTSLDVAHHFERSLAEYQQAGLWMHQACSANLGYNDTSLTLAEKHARFQLLSDHVQYAGVSASTLGFAEPVAHAQRQQLENETRAFLRDLNPDYMYYRGFVGYEFTLLDPVNNIYLFDIQPRPVKETYYNLHLVGPLFQGGELPGMGMEFMLDYDFWSMPIHQEALSYSLEHWQPSVTSPTCMTSPFSQTTHCFLNFLHPGMPPKEQWGQQHDDNDHLHGNKTSTTTTPDGMVFMNVLVPDFFAHVGRSIHLDHKVHVYVYDVTQDEHDTAQYLSIGSALFEPPPPSGEGDPHFNTPPSQLFLNTPWVTMVPNRPYDKVKDNDRDYLMEFYMMAANRKWTFVFVASEDDYPLDRKFVILGAVLIWVACLLLTLWLYTSYRRLIQTEQLRAAAEQEKAALLVESARVAARKERELNDFIAHEVRNPLSAALSANSFVSALIQEEAPSRSLEKQSNAEDDIAVIDNSLNFINDLLRNMLDLHRSQSNQLKLHPTPTGVLSDILQPVASMLRNRGDPFDFYVECVPSDLVIMADKLRLKQIVLNLGRNSVKFVTRGFVRLKAYVDYDNNDKELKQSKHSSSTASSSGEGDGERGNDNNIVVRILIQDSGPGIPVEKRGRLFNKFQESLDSLHQGTGIGLAVVRQLIDLMGGDVELDESYHSGIEGCPGASFVISLPTQPIAILEEDDDNSTTHNDGDPLNLNETNAVAAKPLDVANASSPDGGALLPVEPTLLSPAPTNATDLPKHLSVLFIDDDVMVRKLFMRSLKRVAPEWETQEASNGETGLQMATALQPLDDDTPSQEQPGEPPRFDVIFIDQYMASVDKQMLGTETARAMRSAGVTSLLVGLSANDMEDNFLQNGADAFMMKPFPCAPSPLKEALLQILNMKRENVLDTDYGKGKTTKATTQTTRITAKETFDIDSSSLRESLRDEE